MPNSILPQDQDGQKVYNAISSFSKNEILNSTSSNCGGFYFRTVKV